MARAHWHSNKWGGKRPGAGRPLHQAPCRRISITLSEDLLRTVEQEVHHRSLSRSAVIAQYLVQATKGTQTDRKKRGR